MRRNGLRGNREGALSGSDGNRVAAVQVVILAVRTGAVARQIADAAADADEVCIRRQGHRADVAAVLHMHRFAADPDLARDALSNRPRLSRLFQIIGHALRPALNPALCISRYHNFYLNMALKTGCI